MQKAFFSDNSQALPACRWSMKLWHEVQTDLFLHVEEKRSVSE